MRTTADRITQRMAELGIKQADIMRKTGAGRATISSWVDGKTEPSAKYLPKLAEVLKCNSDWLVSGQIIQNQVNNQHGYIGGSVNQSVVNRDCPDNDDWFIVTDHALSPTFCKNDHVLIDRTRKPQAGDYVLAEHDGKQIFRKYRPPRFDDNGTEYEQLVVYNDDYPILDSRFHTFAVLGVAVEHKRRLV